MPWRLWDWKRWLCFLHEGSYFCQFPGIQCDLSEVLLSVTSNYWAFFVSLLLDYWPHKSNMIIYHLWRDVCSDTLPIFLLSFYYWVVRVLWYILQTGPLLEIWFANSFSHYIDCLFTLMVSFEAQKFLILMTPDSSIFSFFFACALVSYLRIHVSPCHEDLLVCFLPRMSSSIAYI